MWCCWRWSVPGTWHSVYQSLTSNSEDIPFPPPLPPSPLPQGIQAVIAESFERIHRSNLVGMGLLPLQFRDEDSTEYLGLSGRESYSIHLPPDLRPGQLVTVTVSGEVGRSEEGRSEERRWGSGNIVILCSAHTSIPPD